jgi:N-acetylneuraminic acid mutarotase
VASARIGSYVYVLGGFDQATGRTTTAVERFDLVHRRWTSSRPLPVALNHASAFGYRGSLYVLDGYASAADTSTAATNAFWREDLATGRWHRLPSAPTARAALAVGVIGHRLYAAGGSNGRQALRTLEAFDFKTRRWLAGPPLGVAREHVGGAVVGGAFYVLAGRTSGVNLAAAERYVPARGWQRLPSVPVKRSGFGAVVVGHRIVVFGGEGPGGTIAPVEAFDTRRSRWTSLPPMRTPRHGLGAVAFGHVVYALEGGPRPGLTYSRAAERLGVR